jgi:hypothetical protein
MSTQHYSFAEEALDDMTNELLSSSLTRQGSSSIPCALLLESTLPIIPLTLQAREGSPGLHVPDDLTLFFTPSCGLIDNNPQSSATLSGSQESLSSGSSVATHASNTEALPQSQPCGCHEVVLQLQGTIMALRNTNNNLERAVLTMSQKIDVIDGRTETLLRS